MAAEGTEAAAAGAAAREPVDVAVGVLFDGPGPQARFLLTTRPAGKVYAGWWEFPGGKVERGETVAQALARELHEELGIAVDAADVQPWRQEIVDYPHARVRLHFCRLFAWRGAFEMREGQQMAWQALPLDVAPVLPGTVPVLRWLAAERGFTGETHNARGTHDGHGAPHAPGQPPAGGENAAMDWLDEVRFNADGLVPAIAQEAGSKDLLMVAWMNREALAQTLARGQAVYWSRSRGRLWHKGEESGHVQQVHEIRLDCDADVVLLTVTQAGQAPGAPGVACHTGRHSCFYRRLQDGAWVAVDPVLVDPERVYR
jgi:mutator protein MutT